MIKTIKGNILRADVEALVNTVNTVGVMGKGIALQFKKAFPENYKAYEKVCKNGELKPGHVYIYERNTFINPKYIINFPTKQHWKEKSKYEYITAGLDSLVHEIKARNITTIAIPPLGCGLGGLDWPKVKYMIENAFLNVTDVSVFLYEPAGSPEPQKMINRTERPEMTFGQAALIELLNVYNVPGYDYPLTLLEAQKLMYFLQVSGEKLKLDYVKHAYGPYADNLRHVLDRIDGHFITGYGDGKNKPDVPIQIKDAGVIKEAHSVLQSFEKTRHNIERVKELIFGFETPFGMELLSSVHWLAAHQSQGVKNIEQVVKEISNCSERKRKIFNRKQVEITVNHLRDKEWI